MNAKNAIVALALVSVVGIGVVNAQPSNPPGGEGGRGRGGLLQQRDGGRDGLMRSLIAIVTEATGLDGREIAQQLRDGSTLADLIVANGGDVNAVIAQAMTDLTDRAAQAVENGRITQERADELLANLEQRLTDAVNNEAPFGGAFRDRGVRGTRADEAMLIESVMEATGLTRGQVLGQLIDGATLGSIITDNGGSVDAVVADALAAATERANEAVANGQITQERADELLARLSEFYQNAMSGTLRENRAQA